MNNYCCIYTAHDIADKLHININTVYSHIRNNMFPFRVFRLGRKYVVSAEEFDGIFGNGVTKNQ